MLRTIVLFVCLSFGAWVTGCSQAGEKATGEVKLHSAEKIIAVFAEQELTLKKSEPKAENVFEMKLNGRTPQVFALNGKQVILYQFASAEDREEGWVEFGKRTATADLIPFNQLNEGSLLLFYVHGIHPADDEIHDRLAAALKALSSMEDTGE
ncbi:hypothetical protein D3C73_1151120 [compost metagenome]